MTAGEDEPKTIVGNLSGIIVRLFESPDHSRVSNRLDSLCETSSPPDAIDRLMPGRLNDPGARRLRYSRRAPLIDCRCKCFLDRVFSDFEITGDPDQCSQDPAPIGPI